MRLAIYGAGGHGRVVADAAGLNSIWSEIVFFDESFPDFNQSSRWPVNGQLSDLIIALPKFDGVIVAVGACVERVRLIELLRSKGASLVSIIHPSAVIASDCKLGDGVMVCAMAVINTGSIIGDAVIINTAATIDHDAVLEAGVHISPGANLAGGVSVGLSSWVGIGASVKQQVVIGDYAVVGAGAVVIENVLSGMTVVGVPASPINNGLE